MRSQRAVSAFSLVICLVLLLNANFSMAQGQGRQWRRRGAFKKTTGIILSNQDELGLSNDQVEKIAGLRDKVIEGQSVITDAINRSHDALQEEMVGPEINMGKVDRMLDKEFTLRAKKAKDLAHAYNDLFGVLTKEQKKKFEKMKPKAANNRKARKRQ